MKVKYSRFRHNAKLTSFTSPTGPRRQGDEQEHAQYPTNDYVTSGWSCRRPENLSILSSLQSPLTLRHYAIDDYELLHREAKRSSKKSFELVALNY